MRITIYLLTALFCFITTCCQQDSMIQQLVEIDSIANKEGDTKALELINKIEPEMIDNEECLAYYWFLKIRSEIRLQKRIKSADPLEIPINYYKHYHNYSKLVCAYGYKAQILTNIGDLKNASTSLKEAELLIKHLPNNPELANYIYYNLGNINYKAKEYDLALKYCKLSLKASYQMNSKHNMAYALKGGIDNNFSYELHYAECVYGRLYIEDENGRNYFPNGVPLILTFPDGTKSGKYEESRFYQNNGK